MNELLDRIVHWVRCDDAQASISAATELLDFGFGIAIDSRSSEECIARWIIGEEATAVRMDRVSVGALIKPPV